MGHSGVADARRLDRTVIPRSASRVLVPGDQPPGCVAVPRRRSGAHAARPQQRRLGSELLAYADSAVHPDGGSPVPHRPRCQGDRRRRAPDPAGPGAPRSGGGRGGDRGFRGLRVDPPAPPPAPEPPAFRGAFSRPSPPPGDPPPDRAPGGRPSDPPPPPYP